MIRKMKTDELEAVMALWLRTNIEAHNFVDESYWRANYDSVKEMLPNSSVFVYEESGVIQGFIGLTGGFIAGIFVAANHQSKGVGKALLDFAKKDHSELALQVYKKNARAVRFYERENFTLQKESIDESTGEVELLMRWKR